VSCPTPETAAAWLLGELAETEAEAFEQHYFECTACFESVQRLERTAQVLSVALPFTLTRARRDALVARTPLRSVSLQPGERATLQLSADEPAGLWVMCFTGPTVERVDLEARSASGQMLFGLADVAFDAEQGRVYMPCQIHYQYVFPNASTLVVALSSPEAGGGARELGRYILDHHYDSP
jgi:hypothetical protein